jgi:3-oxoacyl-[acyl-carrier protein] reductase/pteridine reductase
VQRVRRGDEDGIDVGRGTEVADRIEGEQDPILGGGDSSFLKISALQGGDLALLRQGESGHEPAVAVEAETNDTETNHENLVLAATAGKIGRRREEFTIAGMNSIQGKVVLVTGGARRLGQASALALARAGADVVITYRESATDARRTVEKLKAVGSKALALPCDVTSEVSVRRMIRAIIDQYGHLDILVNNAANYEAVAFDRITLAQWDAIFASNVRGPFLVSREARKALSKSQGKIINMGSLGGLRPWADHAHYCSSKAALHMLTRVMAKALAPKIAVNAVAPGMIDLGEKAAARFMRKMAKQTPMLRNGKGSEIADAVLFFAQAPRFITGQILAVDGGLEWK